MDGVSAAEYTGADDTQRISHVTCVKIYTVYSCLFNGSCVLDPVIFFVYTFQNSFLNKSCYLLYTIIYMYSSVFSVILKMLVNSGANLYSPIFYYFFFYT